MAEVSDEFDYLRDKHRQLRAQNSPELNLRTHRSISWIARAGALIDDDPDAAFIFSWIAFNAAYAKDMGDDPGSFARADFQNFFDALVRCDPKGRLGHEIWHHFEGVVAELLDNKYIFSPFWKFHNGDAEYDNWERRLGRALLSRCGLMGAHCVGDCRRPALSHRRRHGCDRAACSSVPYPHQPLVSQPVSVAGTRLSGVSRGVDRLGGVIV